MVCLLVLSFSCKVIIYFKFMGLSGKNAPKFNFIIFIFILDLLYKFAGFSLKKEMVKAANIIALKKKPFLNPSQTLLFQVP